jgi:aminoglycoside phosphotransferase (APT) family kinase protein
MWEHKLEPDAVRAAYRRMGEFLAALHRIGMPGYGYITTEVLDPVADNATHMRRKFGRQLREFLKAGGPAELHDAVARRVAAGAHCFAACTGPVLCHNDLHEGTVLVDDAGAVAGFVDDENAEAADPMSDLAKTLQFELSRSAAKRAALFDGYGPLPPHGAERIELYRLYHAIELWTWFTSIGHAKGLPDLLDDIRSLSDDQIR